VDYADECAAKPSIDNKIEAAAPLPIPPEEPVSSADSPIFHENVHIKLSSPLQTPFSLTLMAVEDEYVGNPEFGRFRIKVHNFIRRIFKKTDLLPKAEIVCGQFLLPISPGLCKQLSDSCISDPECHI
jgi:hypothetical protein